MQTRSDPHFSAFSVAARHLAKLGELVRCQRYQIGGVPLLIYSVKMEDGTILRFTEECLSERNSDAPH